MSAAPRGGEEASTREAGSLPGDVGDINMAVGGLALEADIGESQEPVPTRARAPTCGKARLVTALPMWAKAALPTLANHGKWPRREPDLESELCTPGCLSGRLHPGVPHIRRTPTRPCRRVAEASADDARSD